MRTKIVLFSISLMLTPYLCLAEAIVSEIQPILSQQQHAKATQHAVESTAIVRLKLLVKKKIIDKSWQSETVLKSIQSELMIRDDEEVWAVHFNNKNRMKNPVNKVLYVYLKTSGEYFATKFNK